MIQPETVVRWHRAGFRSYWRWKSCALGGRPRIETDLRVLIRRMSVENPLWGAPRIHRSGRAKSTRRATKHWTLWAANFSRDLKPELEQFAVPRPCILS